MNRPLLDLNRPCPSCAYVFETATCQTGPSAIQPAVGDISVCINCGEFLEFGEEEMKKLPEHISYLGPRSVHALLTAREGILARKRATAKIAAALLRNLISETPSRTNPHDRN